MFSNRSAAYLARKGADDAVSAIADASTAIKLDPSFAKGYHRKGCALLAIGEIEDAIAVFQAGLGVDSANSPLREGLQQANAALASKAMRAAVAAASGGGKAAAGSGSAPAREAPLDDAMAAFEAELAGLSAAKPSGASSYSTSKSDNKQPGKQKSPSDTLAAEIAAYFDAEAEDTWDAAETRAAGTSDVATNGGADSDSETETYDGSIITSTGSSASGSSGVSIDPAAGLTDEQRAEQTARLAAQDLGSGAAQIERLTGRNSKWVNLNPYDVLMLPHTASEDDIKARFRRLSALVHPDKNTNDSDRAGDAFNEVRKAQELALDGPKRNVTIAMIKTAQKEVRKVRRRKLRAGVPEALLPNLDSELLKATRKAFAEREMRRRNYEARVKAEAAREAAEEFDKSAAMVEEHKAEQDWASRRESRMESWQSFQAAKKRKLGEGETLVSDAIRFGAAGSGGGGAGGGDASGASAPDYKKRWR